MALADFLNSTVSLERPTSAPDSSGAATSTFSTVTGKSALPCAIWANSSYLAQAFQQNYTGGNYTLAFAISPAARAGDRFNHGGTYYLVNGMTMKLSNGAVSVGPLYLYDCTLTPRN